MGANSRMAKYRAAMGIRSAIFGIIVNVLFAMTKGIAGVIGNSYALIADAVESALDIFSSVAVLGGLKIAAIPPDRNHPYGHGKAEPLAAIVIALVLMATAIALTAGSIREILTVSDRVPEVFTLYVLVVVVIIKEGLFRFVIRVGQKTDSTAVQADAWHHRSDALTSLAAFFGILIAVIGGKGYESADDWAALFAAGIILVNAYRIFRPALDEVMDATPSPELESEVRQKASTVKGVRGLDKCKIRKTGLEYYVDLHVIVDGSMSVRSGHAIAHRVKDELKKFNPMIADVTIHVEPG